MSNDATGDLDDVVIDLRDRSEQPPPGRLGDDRVSALFAELAGLEARVAVLAVRPTTHAVTSRAERSQTGTILPGTRPTAGSVPVEHTWPAPRLLPPPEPVALGEASWTPPSTTPSEGPPRFVEHVIDEPVILDLAPDAPAPPTTPAFESRWAARIDSTDEWTLVRDGDLITLPPQSRPPDLPGAQRAPTTDRERRFELARSVAPARRRTWAIGLMLMGSAVAILLFHVVVLSDLSQARSQRELRDEFQRLLTTGLALPSDPAALPQGQPVALLRVPAIGLDNVVVEGSGVRELKRGPGHVRSTPLPGQSGNAVISGRRSTYGAPFSSIGRLAAGDPILVTTGQGRFTYDVIEVRHLRTGDEDVIGESKENLLTLISADPGLPSLDAASGRIAVIARLRDQPVRVLQVIPGDLSREELGLSGGGGFVLAAIGFWALLLGGALTVTVLLRRSWLPRPTHLIMTPILMVLIVQLCSTLDTLFPSSL